MKHIKSFHTQSPDPCVELSAAQKSTAHPLTKSNMVTHPFCFVTPPILKLFVIKTIDTFSTLRFSKWHVMMMMMMMIITITTLSILIDPSLSMLFSNTKIQ